MPRIIASEFHPAPCLANRHVQTILPSLLRRGKARDFVQQELQLPDGDFVDLAWSELPPGNTKVPIVIIFHGLEGSVHSPYAQGIMRSIRKKGWYAVVMHFRGCSGRPNRLPRSYHSGDTSDAKFLLHYLQEHYPAAPLFAIGYSLGGNMLLKLQGEAGSDSPLSAAISVCAPLRLDICANEMRKGFARIYQRILLRHLIDKVSVKFARHNYTDLIGLGRKQIASAQDFWQFDNLYTAPIHGFRNAEEYYARSSARQFLARIARPTLVIQSLDDPFMSPDVIPSEEELSSSVTLEICKQGGHVGFIEVHKGRPGFWLERRIPDYIASRIANA